MPRNVRVTSGMSDPLNQTISELLRSETQRPASAESVNSPYHPANSRREHDERVASHYTFRQRNVKLNFTLGWELEANHAPHIIPSGVELIHDGSVDGDGAEFVVLPAVTKSPRYVLGLLKDLVHTPRLNTNKSCGFHVHVSASNLSSLARMRQWAIATEHLALQVEDLAFKAVPDARQSNQYCRRITPIQNGASFSSYKYDNTRRYHWLNIVEMFRPNGIRTIEVRLLGNTHRWKYLLAWSLFSMELARRGWDISNKPFDVAGHVDALGQMLQKIAKDIKPLEKRNEPIPQWIYEGFKEFSIDPNTWERPLAKLTETEADIVGMPRRIYTDNQPEIPMERNEDDDEDNSCPCGCGEDGYCGQYTHDNGDCDSAYCYQCHEEDNCGGLPRCESCIDRAHDNGESCERTRCGTCHPVRRVTPVSSSGVTTGRISSVTSNVRIDSTGFLTARAYDANLYGSSIGSIVYDEAAHIEIRTSNGTLEMNEAEAERISYSRLDSHEAALTADREHRPVRVLPTLPEELALPMTDMERLASDGRERAHSPNRQTGRALTVAELETMNRQNENRLRGDR